MLYEEINYFVKLFLEQPSRYVKYRSEPLSQNVKMHNKLIKKKKLGKFN